MCATRTNLILTMFLPILFPTLFILWTLSPHHLILCVLALSFSTWVSGELIRENSFCWAKHAHLRSRRLSGCKNSLWPHIYASLQPGFHINKQGCSYAHRTTHTVNKIHVHWHGPAQDTVNRARRTQHRRNEVCMYSRGAAGDQQLKRRRSKMMTK